MLLKLFISRMVGGSTPATQDGQVIAWQLDVALLHDFLRCSNGSACLVTMGFVVQLHCGDFIK